MSEFIKRHRLPFAVILVLVFFLVLKDRRWNFDDGFIVYRVVERIVSGAGWSYNNGETLNVSTSALNTILISLIAKLGVSAPLAAHLVGGLGLLLVGCFGYLLLLSVANKTSALIVGGMLVAFLSGNLTWGLETHLFIGLFFLSIYLGASSSAGQLSCGLLVLARPDGGLLPLMQILAMGAERGWRKCLDAKILWVILVVLPWIVFSLWKFGQVFPDTLGRKMWQARSGLWGEGNIYKDYFLSHVAAMNFWGIKAGLGFFLVAAGLVRVVARKSPLLYFVLFAVFQQLVYLAIVVPGYHWYTAYWDAACVMLFLIGVVSAWEVVVQLGTKWWAEFREAREMLCKSFMGRLVAGVLLIGLAALWGAEAYRNPSADLRTKAYEDVARKVSQFAPEAHSFSAFEVGVFGYYLPGLSAVDLTGLTSTRGEFITGKRNEQFFESPADVFIAYHPETGFDKPVMSDPRFKRYYDLVATSRTPGFSEIRIYRLKSDSPALMQIGDACRNIKPVDAVAMVDQLADVQTPASGALVSVQGGRLLVRGWLVGERNELLAEPVLVLRDQAGLGFYLPLQSEQRPDVAEHLKKDELVNAGFSGWGGVNDMPQAVYTLEFCSRGMAGVVRHMTGIQVRIGG